MNSHDLGKIPDKETISQAEKLGCVDKYGLYHIEMPAHHIYMDERNFFSRYMWAER